MHKMMVETFKIFDEFKIFETFRIFEAFKREPEVRMTPDCWSEEGNWTLECLKSKCRHTWGKAETIFIVKLDQGHLGMSDPLKLDF